MQIAPRKAKYIHRPKRRGFPILVCSLLVSLNNTTWWIVGISLTAAAQSALRLFIGKWRIKNTSITQLALWEGPSSVSHIALYHSYDFMSAASYLLYTYRLALNKWQVETKQTVGEGKWHCNTIISHSACWVGDTVGCCSFRLLHATIFV